MDNDANWELFVVVYVIQSVDILMFQEHHNSVHDYKFVLGLYSNNLDWTTSVFFIIIIIHLD